MVRPYQYMVTYFGAYLFTLISWELNEDSFLATEKELYVTKFFQNLRGILIYYFSEFDNLMSLGNCNSDTNE